ncbi:uncharacterized protein LOC130741016 isoform X2 [Lotus japonicus]|uniref:uncharacterized protein LOC130741016 isoform X2 n=1 Tax=Lotus japonicus TaxID=34305 RepID=UPI00258FD473|nr:uncharacterized protein LOC130741016 isoform X2 [Lotus japonicus]
MENRVCTFLGRPMRRKFPTTHDLPKGCGQFASRFKLDITDSDCANNTIVEYKNGEHLEGGTDIISKCEKDTQHSELKNDTFLTEKENPVVSSLQLDEPTLSTDDLANTPLAGIETSATKFARTEKSVQHDSTVGEFAPHKVSAIRDLPKGCGRFASWADSDCANKRAEGSLPNGRGQQALTVNDNKRKHVDIVQADSEGNANLPSENKRVKYIALPEKSNHHQVSTKTKATVVQEESRDAGKVERTSGLVHPKVQRLVQPWDMPTVQHKLKGDYNRLPISSDRKEVPGLTDISECLWRSDECSSKSNLFGGTNESKGRKADFFAQLDRSKAIVKAQNALNHSVQKPLKQKMGSAPSNDRGQILFWGKKDSLHPNKNNNFQIVPKSHNNLNGHENVARSKVRETMRLFQDLTRKLLQEVEAKPNGRARVDLQAAKILKEKGKYVNTGKQILGSVPGVEVGDKFQYRVELNIIGLHRQIQGGIDYVKHNGKGRVEM